MKTTQKTSSFCRKTAKDVARLWDDPKVFDTETLLRVVAILCEEVRSPLAQKVLGLIETKDYDRLVDIAVNPGEYLEPALYRADSQIIALVKKYPHWSIELDPKEEAIKTFIACEVQCKQVNDQVFSGSLSKDPYVSRVLTRARRIIANILGECPDVTELSFDFGPGSTYSISNRNATAASKLCSTLDVTPNCYGLARKILLDCPGLRDDCEVFDHSPGSSAMSRVTLIQGDRLAFVPKTAKTHRPIAITGFLNSVIQKGYGKAIRERLRPCVDLRFAQFLHRDLAKISSLTNEYSTIDLKNASDTIAYAIVMELLPWPWFDILDRCRSKYYSYEGSWYAYQKFSAMGNAYTFELETLIFYALVESVRLEEGVEGKVTVFGDDIILPQQCFKEAVKLLEAFGFTTNLAKSFESGNFRESCGGDFMSGEDVRPFYLKDRITYRTVFLFHNFLVRKGWCFLFRKTFLFLRRLLGQKVCASFRGPDVEGDGHLVDVSLPLCSFHAVASKRYKKRHKVKLSRNIAVMLYRLYSADLRENEDSFLYETRKHTRSYLSYHRHI
jgi:hypothetical protein